jgi:hypothetical protein
MVYILLKLMYEGENDNERINVNKAYFFETRFAGQHFFDTSYLHSTLALGSYQQDSL